MLAEETSVIVNICEAYIKSGRTSNFVMSFNKNVDLWLHSTYEELFLFDKKFNVRCLFDIKAIQKFVEYFPGISILHINNKKISLIDYHLETKMDLNNNCPVIQIIIELFEPDFNSTGPDFTFSNSQDFLNSNPTSKLFFLKICSQNQSRISNSPEHKLINATSQSNEVTPPQLQSPKPNSNADDANIKTPNPQSASKIKLKFQSLNDLKEMMIQVYKERNISELPIESTIPKNRFVQNPETGLLESPQIAKVKKPKEQKTPKDPNAPKQPKAPRKTKVIDPNMPPKEKKIRVKKEKKEEKISKESKEAKAIKDAKEVKEIKNVKESESKIAAPIIVKDQKLPGNQQIQIEGNQIKNTILPKLPSVQFNSFNRNLNPNQSGMSNDSLSKLISPDIPIPQLVGKRGLQEAPIPELEPPTKKQKIN